MIISADKPAEPCCEVIPEGLPGLPRESLKPRKHWHRDVTVSAKPGREAKLLRLASQFSGLLSPLSHGLSFGSIRGYYVSKSSYGVVSESLPVPPGRAAVRPGLEDDFLLYFFSWAMLTVVESRESGIGYQVWPAGSILAALLLDPNTGVARLVNNKTILELGSGCGIAGLAAAFAGAKKVFLTDRKEVLDHLRENLEINRSKLPVPDAVMVEELEWGKEVNPQLINRDSIDVIIASDCMYWASLYERLVMTLLSLSTPKTLILLVHQARRRVVERTFYEQLSAFFVISRVCELQSSSPTPFAILQKQPNGSLLPNFANLNDCEHERQLTSGALTDQSGPQIGTQDPLDGRFPRLTAPLAARPPDAPPTDAERGPVYLAYCRLRRGVTPDAAAAALRGFARDQADPGYLMRQLDLMADDIASIRPEQPSPPQKPSGPCGPGLEA